MTPSPPYTKLLLERKKGPRSKAAGLFLIISFLCPDWFRGGTACLGNK